MKQLIIEPVGSKESRLYITPAIINHQGRVIYIASNDDREYFEIENVVKSVPFTKGGFDFSSSDKVFLKWSSRNYNDEKAIFDCLFRYKQDSNLLIVVGDAFAALGYFCSQFLKLACTWDADIIAVLQSPFYEKKLKQYNDKDWLEDDQMRHWEGFHLGEHASLVHHFHSLTEDS